MIFFGGEGKNGKEKSEVLEMARLSSLPMTR